MHLTLRAAPDSLVVLSRPEAHAPIESVRIKDEAGEIAAGPVEPSAREIRLARAVKGALELDYDVVGQPKLRRDVHDVVVNFDVFLAPSESLLLIPSELPAGEVDVEIDARTIYASAGSTLGIGEKFERRLTPGQLRRTTWIAGNLGTGTLQNFMERDVGIWTPTPTFDSRGLLAETAEVRSLMGQFFGVPDATPYSYLFVAYGRGGGSVAAQRRAGGMIAWMDVRQQWNGRLRMAIAQQLAYHWIGELLWVGPDDPEHEAESYWFVEGFVRYYARELLFRGGVIDPAEYLAELRTLGAEQATSPLRTQGNVELARAARSDSRAVAMLRARGALYATRTGSLLRKASKGKTGLDPIVAALLKQVKEARRTIAVAELLDKLRARLGPAADQEYERFIVKGQPIEIPPDALLPCFTSAPTKYAIEAPGFDPDATLASAEHTVARLVPDGPAAKAGLRAQDTVEEIRTPTAASRGKMEVVVSREGKPVTIAFSPYAGTVTGQGWQRDPKVRDEACQGN